MLRLCEIGIFCFDKKLSELGVNLPDSDVPGRALIDLDKVESAYQSPDGDLIIKMDSGDSYLTRSFQFDTFTKLLWDLEGDK